MRAMGYTLNNFTMLGLVFAVGIVIDDAIVVLENIHRTMEENGWDAKTAASYGTREIALAVMATTLSLVVIFLPLAFMSGRVGRFFSSYGVTVAFAIMVSLFVSFTLTPMLASRFLRHTDDPASDARRRPMAAADAALAGVYLGVLGWSLRTAGWSWAPRACCIAIVASGRQTKFTFMPQDDSSEFEIACRRPRGPTSAAPPEVRRGDRGQLRALRIDGQPVITTR